MAGDPKTVLALVISQPFQDTYEKILEKLFAWAWIDTSYVRALRD